MLIVVSKDKASLNGQEQQIHSREDSNNELSLLYRYQ